MHKEVCYYILDSSTTFDNFSQDNLLLASRLLQLFATLDNPWPPLDNIDKLLTHLTTMIGRGGNRAVTELSFAHVTTKPSAYSGVFGFFRQKSLQKNCPPNPNHFFENTLGNQFIFLLFKNMEQKFIFLEL